MSLATSYGFLILAVLLGVTSNSFAKSAEGFTLLFPSIITGITIVACMYALSMVMKNIPMGITYASFAILIEQKLLEQISQLCFQNLNTTQDQFVNPVIMQTRFR